MKKSVSILGCGWLGKALMENLLSEGYSVKGSSTSEDGVNKLQKSFENIFRIKISETGVEGENTSGFFDSDVLIINISPGRNEEDTIKHPEEIKKLISEINKSGISLVIFISSTSVYPDLNKTVTETDSDIPDKPSGRALLECEKILQSEKQFATTIIRFGGLIGYDRMPARFLSGKKNLSNGNAPVNLIHRDDCIGIIKYFIANPAAGTYNACAPVHPTRKTFYTAEAIKNGFPLPEFKDEETEHWKIVSSDKLLNQTGYYFIHPDPSEIS